MIGGEIATMGSSFTVTTRTMRLFSTAITTTTTRRLPLGIPNFGGVAFRTVRAGSGPKPNSPIDNRNVSSLPQPEFHSSTKLQGDLNYMLKLAVGSVLGAALVKYGSVLIPDITKPNLTQALLMISTPMVVAVVILLNESRKK